VFSFIVYVKVSPGVVEGTEKVSLKKGVEIIISAPFLVS
jgi:hypothetical protein